MGPGKDKKVKRKRLVARNTETNRKPLKVMPFGFLDYPGGVLIRVSCRHHTCSLLCGLFSPLILNGITYERRFWSANLNSEGIFERKMKGR